MNAAPIEILTRRAFPTANRKRRKVTIDEIKAIVGKLTPAEAKLETQRLGVIYENMRDLFGASVGTVERNAIQYQARSEIVDLFATLDKQNRHTLWRELALHVATAVQNG